MPWRLAGVLFCLACLMAAAAAAAATTGGGLLQEGIDRLQLSPEAQLQQQSPLASSRRFKETAEGQDEVCTQSFRDAFNAAVSHVIGTRLVSGRTEVAAAPAAAAAAVCYESSRRSSSKRCARISNTCSSSRSSRSSSI
ncbi:hypothetical protein Emag_001516 [Eimeria magna]